MLETERPFNGIEQRNSLRWPAEFQVGYGIGDQVCAGTAVNISESGLSFRGSQRFEVGTQISISLHMPGRVDVLNLTAEVRRLEADGMHGVEFANVSVEQKAHILEIIYELIAIRRQ